MLRSKTLPAPRATAKSAASIVEQLTTAIIFSLAVLARGSHAKTFFPPGVKTVAADYESLDDLTLRLRALHAVVCVVPGHPEALLLRIVASSRPPSLPTYNASSQGSLAPIVAFQTRDPFPSQSSRL
ncbi:hypothetical protein CORC01_07543 [Colletotrichum orchidophilum]|uniref:Uncharacterized protein n=1 Tax=Colletotrichum orchidophilum TaxID=1209926 RepID=A0A1G4B748_9PEZI|nr:uncharacterized protein CORC01_07543 [Colletotrichum orchidophilum]OHE97102.1 hypothetical protein CORC01_07543 [Colletotrichum orchidophilum]